MITLEETVKWAEQAVNDRADGRAPDEAERLTVLAAAIARMNQFTTR